MTRKARIEEFPLMEASKLVRDLFQPKPVIYWLDFLAHAALGWGAFAGAALTVPFTPLWFGLSIVAVFALYRAAIFTHELAHLKKGTFGAFRMVWNLIAGFPLMIPSFTYHGVHNDHHRKDLYGTREDGEYLPFGAGPPFEIPLYILTSFALPLLLATRFIVLTPLSYLLPPLRRWVWTHGSSLSIDLSYRRPPPGDRDDPTWPWQEFGTFAYGATAIALTLLGWLPWSVPALWYGLTVTVFVMNGLRTLGAHAYRNPGEAPMTLSQQFLDSVNVPGHRFFTTLWAPVGLRYHATHHLFANMPYHNLGEAHRRLLAGLSDPELYRSTIRTSLIDAIRRLWADARASTAKRVKP